jgi:hypothetical protein
MDSVKPFRLLTTALASAALVPLTYPRSAEAVRNASASTMADLFSQSMGDMPAMDRDISIDIRNGPSIRCAAGEYPADCYPVGTLTDLGVGELTLNELGQRTGYSPASVTLVDFELMEWQTVGHLAKVVPELQNYRVGDVAPINEATGGQFSDKLIGELPAATQALGIPTYGYSVHDIPNLVNTPLGTFRDASRSSIRGVPGLGNLKFSQYPQGSQLQAPAFAMVDVAYGRKETNRRNTITGSVQERSWSVPCDKNCSYLELANLSGALAAAAGVPQSPYNFHGAQYIGGDTAKLVKGGWVGEEHNWPGYGYEPTGQLPFGDQFKISVSKVSEPDGSAVLRANARYCQYFFGKRVACTPYGVGQGKLSFPFLRVREKGLIPVATAGSSPNPQDVAKVATAGGSLPSAGASADGGPGSSTLPIPLNAKRDTDKYRGNLTCDQVTGYSPNSIYRKGCPGFTGDKSNNGEDCDALQKERDSTKSTEAQQKVIPRIKGCWFSSENAPDPFSNAVKPKIAKSNSPTLLALNDAPLYGGSPSNATKCTGGHTSPIPGNRITSSFGMRDGRMHRGADIAVPQGTPIRASRDGIVADIVTGYGGGWGNHVILSHPCDKTRTLYAHMSRIGSIKKGQSVKQGQIIGYVGSTGRSTGPHLHYEFIKNGSRVNPSIYVRF